MSDATYLADLKTARDNLAARLAAITASPKPSYSVDGRRFSWVEYQRFLVESLASLKTQIDAAEDYGFEEILTEGYTDLHPPG